MKARNLFASLHESNSIEFCVGVKICKRFFKTTLQIQDGFSQSIHTLTVIYLAVLYALTEQYDKTFSYLNNVTRGSVNRNIPMHVSFFLIFDNVANACGFSIVYNYIVSKLISKPVLVEPHPSFHVFVFLSTISLRNLHPKLFKPLRVKFPRPLSRFDILLTMVTPRRKHLKKNRILITEKNKDPEVDLSQEDKMADLLTKMAVENFTKFLRLESKVEHTFETCKVTSHYKALYYYRQQQYERALDVCDTIALNEASIVLDNWYYFDIPGIFKYGGDVRNRRYHPVLVTSAFQTLFDESVTFLIGLMILIDKNVLTLETEREEYDRFYESSGLYTSFESTREQSTAHLQHLALRRCRVISTIMSPQFLVSYVRIQCLIKLRRPKSEILKVLLQMKIEYCQELFEQVLSFFVIKMLSIGHDIRPTSCLISRVERRKAGINPVKTLELCQLTPSCHTSARLRFKVATGHVDEPEHRIDSFSKLVNNMNWTMSKFSNLDRLSPKLRPTPTE